MKFKKVFSSLMALGLATSLVACGEESDKDNNSDSKNESNVSDKKDEKDDDSSKEDSNSSDFQSKDDQGDELSDKDKADLADFDNLTGDDTLVIGTSEMSGDFFEGWSDNSYDVVVRRLIGTEGTNAYNTAVVDESGQWVDNDAVLSEKPKK